MDENTGVSEATIAMLVIVFTPLWVMVHSSGHFDKSRSFLGAFKRARELFLAKVVFCLDEIAGVAILATVDFWVELTFTDGFGDLLVLFCIIQPILFLFLSEVLLCLAFVKLLHLTRLGRALVIIG